MTPELQLQRLHSFDHRNFSNLKAINVNQRNLSWRKATLRWNETLTITDEFLPGAKPLFFADELIHVDHVRSYGWSIVGLDRRISCVKVLKLKTKRRKKRNCYNRKLN